MGRSWRGCRRRRGLLAPARSSTSCGRRARLRTRRPSILSPLRFDMHAAVMNHARLRGGVFV